MSKFREGYMVDSVSSMLNDLSISTVDNDAKTRAAARSIRRIMGDDDEVARSMIAGSKALA